MNTTEDLDSIGDRTDSIDFHLIYALCEAEKLGMTREDAEYYVRNRLVAMSDTFTTAEALNDERSRRQSEFLRTKLKGQ